VNTILRPVYNRPEMLAISIEYEIAAREHYMIPGEFTTLFVVEYGSSQDNLNIIDKYPYDHRIISRQHKYGLSKNILKGMCRAFDIADNYIIHIEDDVLIHKTFFQYMDILLNTSHYSAILSYSSNNDGDVHRVRRAHAYSSLGTLINKNFFMHYVQQYITDAYYGSVNNRHKTIQEINNKYADNPIYKYRRSLAHNEQAGLISRLVDIAMIEEGMFTIVPEVNRQMHIGYYGSNRGGSLPGNSYNERLQNMRDIINGNKFYEMTQSKQYNDYLVFSDKLDDWDGTLQLVDSCV